MMLNKYIKLFFFILPSVPFFASTFYFFYDRHPEIYFPEGTIKDFGTISEMNILTTSFVVENRGNKPLEIKDMKSNCSCTKPYSEKTILKKGESTKIKITYRASLGIPGKDEVAKILIESNDPYNPIVPLSLVGEVQRTVFWNPLSVSIYCERGVIEKKQFIHFKNYDDKTISIKKIEKSNDKINVSCNQESNEIKCIIGIDPNFPKGHWDENVNFVVDVGKQEKSIKIPVYLIIQ